LNTSLAFKIVNRRGAFLLTTSPTTSKIKLVNNSLHISIFPLNILLQAFPNKTSVKKVFCSALLLLFFAVNGHGQKRELIQQLNKIDAYVDSIDHNLASLKTTWYVNDEMAYETFRYRFIYKNKEDKIVQIVTMFNDNINISIDYFLDKKLLFTKGIKLARELKSDEYFKKPKSILAKYPDAASALSCTYYNNNSIIYTDKLTDEHIKKFIIVIPYHRYEITKDSVKCYYFYKPDWKLVSSKVNNPGDWYQLINSFTIDTFDKIAITEDYEKTDGQNQIYIMITDKKRHAMRNGYHEEIYKELIVDFLKKIDSYIYK